MSTNELAISQPLEMPLHSPRFITCVGCKKTFVYSGDEHSLSRYRGPANEAERCSKCLMLMHMRREGIIIDSVAGANCISCGEKTTVPFLPRDHKKVFCAICYKRNGYKRSKLTSKT